MDLTPCSCEKCNFKFSKYFLKNLKKITRQVIDLNELKKIVIDYENWDVECPSCGFLNVSIFDNVR